jgi:hypothetical protein
LIVNHYKYGKNIYNQAYPNTDFADIFQRKYNRMDENTLLYNKKLKKAGEGNRTLVACLEGRHSTTELLPQNSCKEMVGRRGFEPLKA